METTDLKIDNLLKVTLVMEAGASQDAFKPLTEPKEINFIYGVAADGITPFEKLLYQKQAGDEVSAAVDLNQANQYFGPLSCGILEWLPERGELFFKVAVQAVATPQNSEIVKALAAGGGCGSDCDCGCGCG